MKNPDEMHVKNLRYQDAVARISGIDLKTTVRVLMAIEVTARCNNDDDLARELDRVLTASAVNSGEAAELASRPQDDAVAACNQHFKRVLRRLSWDRVRALQRLEVDPYYASNVTDEVMEGKHD